MADYSVSKETMEKVKAMEGKPLVPTGTTMIWGIMHMDPIDGDDKSGDIVCLLDRDKNMYSYKGEDGFKKFLEDWEVR